jgi:hypothetical protein
VPSSYAVLFRDFRIGDVDAKTRQFEGDAVTESESWWAFTFDEHKLRCDYQQGNELVHKSVLSGDDFISHLSVAGSSSKFVVEMGSVSHRDGGFPGLFYPLVLGMVSAAAGLLHSHGEDSQVGRFLDRPSTVTFDTNANAYRIDYVFDDGSKLRFWIDPKRGNSVIRIERDSRFQQAELLDTVSSEIVQRNGVWFPTKVTWRRSHGDALLVEEILTIRDALFNKNVNHVGFTLAGMNVPAGTYIRTRPNTGSAIWEGSEIIWQSSVSGAMETSGAMDTPYSHRGWGFFRVVMLLGAIVCTALIAYVYFRQLSRKNAG